MRKDINKYNIDQCALYKCSSPHILKLRLGISDDEYKAIANIAEYYTFNQRKKNSPEERTITAPKKRIKEIQRRILQLLQKVQRPEWLISGEKGKCYIDNGKQHMQSNFFLTVDIKGFYDNCKRERVFRFFKDTLKMSGDIAGVCTDIVTYNEGIPTGCPTSQMLAFYAYEQMFFEISEIAQKHGCIFTLYVDDMTFSSNSPFNVNELKREVDCILRKYGHKPKYKKMRYFTRGNAVPITGTVVTGNHKMKVPNRLQESVYTEFQEVKGWQGRTLTTEEKKKIQSLKGRIQAAQNIESDKFKDIDRIVQYIT